MYGMVNNAIRSFIIESHGERKWQLICDNVGVEQAEFAAVLPYDDALSLQLIDHAAAATGKSVEQMMHDIGRYWVHFAARSSFGTLMRFGGADFKQFVRNLDAMHSKIKASLPKLAPPSFRVEEDADGILLVTYSSTRTGLFPFVEGLFVGLSEFFDQSVDILDFDALGPGKAQWRLRVATSGMRLPAA